MADPKKAVAKVQPFFDARGRLLLERRGLPRELGSNLANDAYHFMRTATWTRILVGFFLLYICANVLFALILWLGHANVINSDGGFFDDFWFSVQTMGTIGYGYLAPGDKLSNIVVTIESFIGIGLTALFTGVFFARFATPSARVIFSKVAVIADYDGERCLMFRCANARSTAIVEATVNVYLSRDEVTRSGERVRRIYDLALRRKVSPVFALSWTVYHTLDKTSPLHGVTRDSVKPGTMNLIVTFQGTDERLAATVHTRYAYDPEDIVYDRRFVDILKYDAATGVRHLDFEFFDATEPLATTASAAGPA